VFDEEIELLALDVVDADESVACACTWIAAAKLRPVATVNIKETLGEK
jgi:hypothetical protein